MIPVLGFRLRPAGSAGLTRYEVTAPPLLVGLFAVIGTPLGVVRRAGSVPESEGGCVKLPPPRLPPAHPQKRRDAALEKEKESAK